MLIIITYAPAWMTKILLKSNMFLLCQLFILLEMDMIVLFSEIVNFGKVADDRFVS